MAECISVAGSIAGLWGLFSADALLLEANLISDTDRQLMSCTHGKYYSFFAKLQLEANTGCNSSNIVVVFRQK